MKMSTLPKRRPARAWYRVGSRLQALSELDTENASNAAPVGTLACLAAGSRLAAIKTNLRAQTLEMWSVLDDAASGVYLNAKLDVLDSLLDSTCLLTRAQQQIQVSTESMQDALTIAFAELHRGTTSVAQGHVRALDNITMLGWAAIVRCLVTYHPHNATLVRKVQPSEGGLTNSELQDFDDVLRGLAMTAESSHDLPWGDLADLVVKWDASYSQSVVTLLNRIDESTAIVIQPHCESHRFFIGRITDGMQEVFSSDGARHLHAWQIAVAGAEGEDPKRGFERHMTPNDNSIHSSWSETWKNGRLLSIGVVRPGLAILAGLTGASELL